ncbi:MAG: cadherin-like beta sandwich domain-containing protein [Clostridiales bacterium]|nr:cadherin-like beta sandwich domain-containing protein [Clostridiales bacterium]
MSNEKNVSMEQENMSTGMTRRTFMKGMAAGVAAVSLASILPSNTEAEAASLIGSIKPSKFKTDGIYIEGGYVNMKGKTYTLEFIQPVKLIAVSNKTVQTEGTWRSSNKHLVSVDPDGTVVMRDGVGGHSVDITWSKDNTTYKVTFITGQTADDTIEVDRPQRRGDFMIQLAEYFGWFHYHGWMDDGSDVDDNAEYLDEERVRNYYDVTGRADYVKAIECALDQGVLTAKSSKECFYPMSDMTREDAAVILVKAFKLDQDAPEADYLKAFDDVKKVDKKAYSALNILFGKGYMWGRSSSTINPTDAITPTETRIIIENITRRKVAPVWATPGSGRKFARVRAEMFCPTEGSVIHWKAKTFNWSTDKLVGTKIQDVIVGGDWTEEKEYIHGYTIDPFFGMQSFNGFPYDNLSFGVELQAWASKDGMEDGPVSSFIYRIERPAWHDFATDCLHKGSKKYPMVYRYFDNFQAAAYYIEGSKMGILFDGLMPTNTSITLVDRVKEVATPGKPIIFVLGHNHPDHNGAMPAAALEGWPIYTMKRVGVFGKSGTRNIKDNDGNTIESMKVTYDETICHEIEEGHVFDLGNVKFTAYALPGHTDDMIILHSAETGLLFSSDIYGVNRYWVADQFTAAGIRQDLLLSLQQQLMDAYHKNGGLVKEVYTGHNRTGCGEEYLSVWEQCLQQQVDFGSEYISQDRRASGNTLSISGHPYKSMNWIGFVTPEKQKVVDYVGEVDKKPFRRIETVAEYTPNMYYPDPETVAALSNLQFKDAELVGHDFRYKAGLKSEYTELDDGTLKYIIHNKFVPFETEYEVKIRKTQKTVTLVPTSMSTRAKSITVNGAPAATRCPITVSTKKPVEIVVTAPDGETTMTYTLTFVTK